VWVLVGFGLLGCKKKQEGDEGWMLGCLGGKEREDLLVACVVDSRMLLLGFFYRGKRRECVKVGALVYLELLLIGREERVFGFAVDFRNRRERTGKMSKGCG